MSANSKKVYGNSRLQSPNFTLKLQGCAKVKLGLCNPRVPIYIFGILFHHWSLTAMYLVSSLHFGPYPSWASDTPWTSDRHFAKDEDDGGSAILVGITALPFPLTLKVRWKKTLQDTSETLKWVLRECFFGIAPAPEEEKVFSKHIF